MASLTKEQIATSLVTWDSNGLNKRTAQMAFMKASEKLDTQSLPKDVKESILDDLSQRIKGDIVKTGSEGEYKFRNELDKKDLQSQNAFTGWLGAKRQSMAREAKARAEFVKKGNARIKAEEGFGELLDSIDTGSANSGDMLNAFLGNAESQLRRSGLEDFQIQKQLDQYEKQAGKATFDKLNRDNPESALKFASDNAKMFGASVIGMKQIARNTIKRRDIELQKQELIANIQNIKDYNADQLTELSSRDDKLGEAAKKIMDNPVKLIQQDFGNLNLNDPSTLDARIFEADEAQVKFETPNHPIDIPLLNKNEIKSVKDNLFSNQASAQKTLDFLSREDPIEADRVSRTFGKDPIGQAVRLFKTDGDTALKILEGIKSLNKPGVRASDIADSVSVYVNSDFNNSAIKAMEALSKTDSTLSAKELAEKVVNLQDTNTGFFSFRERMLPVPMGYTGEQFDNVVTKLLSEPKEARKYSNGDMKGGNVDIDYDDVIFEPIYPGVYALKKDDKYLVTQDGEKYVMNLGRALDDRG